MEQLSRHEVTQQSPGGGSASGDCRACRSRRPASCGTCTSLCIAHAMTGNYSIYQGFLTLLLACLLCGCSTGDATGPGEVRWDRETCTRCGMAIGDRYGAAQVRGGPAGELTRLYRFDDIGCAVVWLDDQPWADDPRTGIWVTDHRDGRWIDARQASYVTGIRTSMGYGLGAQRVAAVNGMDFASARYYIHGIEQREHIHGGGFRHPHAAERMPP